MYSISSVRGVARGAVLTASAAMSLAGSSASLAQNRSASVPAVAAAAVTVRGDEAAVGASTTLPAEEGFATTFAAPLLRHFAVGSYGVEFSGLGDSIVPAASGVVHTRIVGSDGACMSDDLENVLEPAQKNALFVEIKCLDAIGRPADRPFTFSYTRGGTQTGAIVTARLNPGGKPDATGKITPHFQQSSVGGTVTVTNVKPGAYTFNLPALPGSDPATIAVSPMAGFRGRASGNAACSILSTALVAGGAVKQVNVACRQPGDTPGANGEPADPGWPSRTFADPICSVSPGSATPI